MKYQYTVEGEYITTEGELDEYEKKFILDEPEEGLARAIIQNSLIHNTLKKDKSLKDYRRWKTCQIVECKEVSGEKESEIDPKLQKLISEATNLGCMPPNFNSLKRDDTKIKKLEDAIEKKKARIKKDKEKNKKS